MAARKTNRRSTEDPELGVRELVELGPTLARLGVLASVRAAGWATSTSASVWKRIAVAARDGESPGELLAEAREQSVQAARRALGVTEVEETLGRLTSQRRQRSTDRRRQAVDLRRRGQELLNRSAQVGADDDRHPAFGLILEQLAPDEMRILRALASGGGQAALTVEASGPLGIGGRRVARRLSLLAQRAGCRHPERVQLYLDNLLRLGLVQVTDEPFDDEELYELLEAQPEVTEAKDEASSGAAHAKSVRGRIELSELGRWFCEACLPVADLVDRER